MQIWDRRKRLDEVKNFMEEPKLSNINAKEKNGVELCR